MSYNPPLTENIDIKQDIEVLAERLFPENERERKTMITRLRQLYNVATGNDFLVVHSPGGWGCTHWENLLDWERSIVTGVTSTLVKLGYNSDMTQYLRSGDRYREHVKDIFKEAKFFLRGISSRAETAAEEFKFLVGKLPDLRVLLVGASQGAAFNNYVMTKLGNAERIYSIELGTFFPHMPRRILTDRTLAIDSNGLMRDPICHRDLWAGFKSYFFGFFFFLKQRFKGNRVKFTHCTNTPGHEYIWEYPGVRPRIEEFLETKFGVKC